MYIKIVGRTNAITSMHECDECSIVITEDEPSVREGVRRCFPNADGEFMGTTVLWLYTGKTATQVLLWESTAYIMNNDGKTIDTIYA